MSKFSASDVAFSGFRLVRENPKTVGVWVLIMTVVSILFSVATIQFFGADLEGFSTYMKGAGADANPQEVARQLEKLSLFILVSLPYLAVVNAVTFAGVNRLILRPHEGGLVKLKLGKDELRQAGVWLLYSLTLFGVLAVGQLVGDFFAAMKDAIGLMLAALASLATMGGLIYMAIRLSLSSPATFDAGKVVFFRAMPLTKGLFWPLVGAYMLAIIMFVIVFILLFTIVSAVAVLISGDFSTAGRMMQADSSSLKAFLTPMGIAQTAFSGLMSVLTTLIIFAPAPTIYKTLREAEETASGNGGW